MKSEVLEHIRYYWVHTQEQKELFDKIDMKKYRECVYAGLTPLEIFQAMINYELLT